MQNNFDVAAQSQSVLATNKVLRNTYALLGFSLIPKSPKPWSSVIMIMTFGFLFSIGLIQELKTIKTINKNLFMLK